MKYLQKFIPIFALAVTLSSTVAAAEDLVHVVGRGETIYSISRFYRVTAEELMRANGISDPSRLQAGRRLTIPSTAFSDINVTASTSNSTSTATSAPSNANRPLADYRIVRGDTLFSIARTHGISLQNLLEINSFSSDHVIKAGDVIKVPGQAAAASSTATASTTQTAAQSTAPARNTGSSASNRNTGTANQNLISLRWPVNAKDVAYMTGQMGVVVEGEHLESVRSLTNGRVISAGPWRKFGRVAIVEASGGYFYMYGGCDSLSVSVGDRVSAGTELGKLGINAVSERPQLFFMVFRSDTPVDPAIAPRAGGRS